jgi:NADH-quinone oxidoreductase subunit H
VTEVDAWLVFLYVLVFPGIFFLLGYSFFTEWFDRKMYAKMQNRVGPPLIQPFADFIKLLSKEDINPEGVEAKPYNYLPLFAFAAVATSFIYIPTFMASSPVGFQGDLLLVLYMMTLPTIILFLVGWYSQNTFATIGAYRAVSQLFVYEVPLFIAALGPALWTRSWSLSDIVSWQQSNPWLFLIQPLGFIIAIICLQAKLERIPFDIPEAETEIVGGPLVEYSGRKLALFRIATDMLMVTGASLIAALYLGGPSVGFSLDSLPSWAAGVIGFIAFLVKTLLIVFLLSFIRAAFARLRLDQMTSFGWKWLASLALFQIFLVIGIRMVVQ